MTNRIEIKGYDDHLNPVWRPAHTARVTKVMLPLPDGYVPVRFDDSRAVLLVHSSSIREAA